MVCDRVRELESLFCFVSPFCEAISDFFPVLEHLLETSPFFKWDLLRPPPTLCATLLCSKLRPCELRIWATIDGHTHEENTHGLVSLWFRSEKREGGCIARSF
jgi:hypothetical protein